MSAPALEPAPVWAALTARMGRNDLPVILANAVLGENGHEGVSLPLSEIPYAIGHTWPLAEWPQATLGLDVWLFLFGMLPDDQYIAEDRLADTDRLPEYLHLYRGCVEGREMGMSWTEDLDRALWFATRFGDHFGQPLLLETSVPRELILAKFHSGRGEAEWVVDVTSLEPADLEGRPVSP